MQTACCFQNRNELFLFLTPPEQRIIILRRYDTTGPSSSRLVLLDPRIKSTFRNTGLHADSGNRFTAGVSGDKGLLFSQVEMVFHGDASYIEIGGILSHETAHRILLRIVMIILG